MNFNLTACLGGVVTNLKPSFISKKPIRGSPEAAGELLRPPKSTFMMSRFMASHLFQVKGMFSSDPLDPPFGLGGYGCFQKQGYTKMDGL